MVTWVCAVKISKKNKELQELKYKLIIPIIFNDKYSILKIDWSNHNWTIY